MNAPNMNASNMNIVCCERDLFLTWCVLNVVCYECDLL